ncbi:MAG: VTT domain-containing protein [Treponema sp.]|nr:VTT domain-containing protein [Treponema sp.]
MIIDFFASYIHYWPLAAFVALLLAGFNLPVSEDAILIASAAICQDNKKLILPTIVFVYLGIVLSDIISYLFGYICSKKLSGFKRIRRMLSSNKKYVIMKRIEEHGFGTFISIRFIPFGMRNLLFLSSGFFHLKWWKFMLFDFTAALISSQTLFWICFILGDESPLFLDITCIVILALLIFCIVRTILGVKKDLAALPNDAPSQEADPADL